MTTGIFVGFDCGFAIDEPACEACGIISTFRVSAISMGKDPTFVTALVNAGVCRPFTQMTFGPLETWHNFIEEVSEVISVRPILLPLRCIHPAEWLRGDRLRRVRIGNGNELLGC